MNNEIDFDEILDNYRADPYGYVDMHTIHTGRIRFKVGMDDTVEGPSGEWRHIPGTVLYELDRERNLKPIHSPTNGTISFFREDLEDNFVDLLRTIWDGNGA